MLFLPVDRAPELPETRADCRQRPQQLLLLPVSRRLGLAVVGGPGLPVGRRLGLPVGRGLLSSVRIRKKIWTII